MVNMTCSFPKGDSVAPEITLPDRINVGEEAKVECVGQIGKDYSGEITGQLLLETNFGVCDFDKVCPLFDQHARSERHISQN
jgi:hypothetical protein